MAAKLEVSDWWSKKGTPVVVTMENPNYSIVQIHGPEDDRTVSKARRGKNAKQFTWVLLLKAHHAAGCLASTVAALCSLLRSVKKRLILHPAAANDDEEQGEEAGEKLGKAGLLLKFIRAFLLFSLFALLMELVAYCNGWHFQLNPSSLNLAAAAGSFRMPESGEIQVWLHSAYLSWLSFRADYIASPIRALSKFCVVLFVIQSLDRLVLCLGCFWIKLNRIKPKLKDDDEGTDSFPMVLVQVPMCNEREVYEQCISTVCQIDWPKDKFLIQVLDDSDDEDLAGLIREEVGKWSHRGVNIVYRHRLIRNGYKAGNLKSAMSCEYVKDYEFVAIFDADFQPNPDILKQTIPHFKGNPEIGLVQARWSFVNKDENLLTHLQNINLCFHFEVEQQVSGNFFDFFGFNGTAGVWRIKALEDSGGWMERTTVEDMDIAVRAHLGGWKFVFLNDVKVLCEVPESYEAYRKQQHRWHSGPMQLFRLCLPAIITSKIPIWKKANLILLFFLLRKLILPFYSFTLFCVILPLTMFVPEAELPVWVICYIPVCMSFLNILPSPKSFPFVVPYLLFENTMSVTKFDAMVSGLFQLGSSYEWVVTKKAGRIASDDPDFPKTMPPPLIYVKKKKKESRNNKIYKKELALALLLLTAAARSLISAQGIHFYFLLFQGVAFLLVGLDLIGEQMS